METPLWKAILAEAVGTFALIFIGAGSILADHLTGGKVGVVGIAFAHGLAIGTMVLAVGAVSGGHFNPAVTLGFLVTGRQPLGRGLSYMAAQLVGASIAALLLTAAFPEATRQAVHLGTPALAGGVTSGVGIVVEAILTFLLVFVIFGTAVDPRGPAPIAGLAIGLVITMDILAGGALTGAAMNPARAFGPALFSNFWENQTVYWIGPALGAAAAALLYHRALLNKARGGER
ncbi:MAG TPA: MIP family channel protein [bacterium]|nr:MIP family channel protein [bacterium]